MNFLRTCLFVIALQLAAASGEEIETDLLIAGATESGWAAGIQAARLGVESIVIVHDGEWFGGQFTEQALACVDENKGMDKVGFGVDWHPMKRAFRRSGLFKELMDRIEAHNTEKYGSPMPGLPYHGPSTFRPAEAEAIFREMIQPYIDSGQIRVIWNRYPVSAVVEDSRLHAVSFAPVAGGDADVHVRAKLTIDATDWGEVIQVSGAAYECGPDPKSRYGEPSAPEEGTFPANEMNPLTWAMIVAESEGETPIPRPARFDDRNFPRATFFSLEKFRNLKWDNPNPGLGAIAHWPAAAEASKRQLSVYSVRRIVDGYSSKDGKTSILLNYMNGQDYPLERLPQHVVDALEKTEPGASEKNIVEMTREQRQIVFEDAKRHAKCVLYHLQNFVHAAAPDKANSFRNFHLSKEFGTPDDLPPKPYIREGLRLKAMYMMREQDGRNRDAETKNGAKPRFSEVMYPDGLFAWQFHYDFHRTGRTYLVDEGASGPWIDFHKPNRHTKFLSDRCVFPLRSLIPEQMDGLLGAQGNVGFSSIVSAAIRLHDQRIHIGQAAGAAAAVSLRENVDPREIVFSPGLLNEVRDGLCHPDLDGAPLLLWPWRDLPADHPAFVAINQLSARGTIPAKGTKVDFRPEDPAEKDWIHGGTSFPVPWEEGDTRAELAIKLWDLLRDVEIPKAISLGRLGGDIDNDGLPDQDDALLFTPNEPIVFEIYKPVLTPETDGVPGKVDDARFFNFSGPKEGRKFDEEIGFGWTRDLSANHRKRNALDGPRDSFVFTRERDVWELAVENGRYRVALCVGDSGHEQLLQRATIEGTTVFDETTTAAGEFAEKSVEVEVADGRLTLEIGSGKPKSNTCVNWLSVQRLEASR